jgi:hypothetical protein
MELKIHKKIDDKVIKYCQQNNIDINSDKKGGLIGLGSKFKTFFFNKKEATNKKIESDIKFIQIKEKIESDEAFVVIKEFLNHFASFEYDIGEAVDIIDQLVNKYNIKKERLLYCISVLNSNLFTIKRKKIIKNKSLNKENLVGDTLKEEVIKLYKESQSKSFNYYSKLNENKMAIITYSSQKYLNTKEGYLVCLINKHYNKKLSNLLFKRVLYSDIYIEKEKRINIWKVLLKYVFILF